MTPVRQTLFSDPGPRPSIEEAAGTGNCLQATVASLLNLRLDDVPHVNAYPRPHEHDALAKEHGDLWWRRLRRWARSQGFDFSCHHPDETPTVPYVGMILEWVPKRASGHCVVGDRDLQVAWDPDWRAPLSSGFSVTCYFAATVPYEPAPSEADHDPMHLRYAHLMQPASWRAHQVVVADHRPRRVHTDPSPFASFLRLLADPPCVAPEDAAKEQVA